MGRIKFRTEGEQHNFWQNYTDLIMGFMIVFIIAALSGLYAGKGNSNTVEARTAENEEQKVSEDEYNAIKRLKEAQEAISDTEVFIYNKKHQWFELKSDYLFDAESSKIKDEYKKGVEDLLRQINERVVEPYKDLLKITIVFDGRAAKGEKSNNYEYARTLSLSRANSIREVWEGINPNFKTLCVGSGFDGEGRYKDGNEDNNKTVVIRVIPSVKIEN